MNKKPKLFQTGDLNGFFGLFTNNLTNVLVLAGLLKVSIGLPDWIVYSRILPAVGLSIFISSLYYTYMGYKIAKRENRSNVTALPSGISVPHMFLIVFLVMGPVYWDTGDPQLAWYAGVAWCFVEGLIELSGSIIGPKIREIVPRTAMLSALAGASLGFIAMTPAMKTFKIPYIGFVSLAIILIGWFGDVKMPYNIPAGLFAIIIGSIIGWSSGLMSLDKLLQSVGNVKPEYAHFSINYLLNGFDKAFPYIAAAIPLGLYNFFETMDNIESASIAGDDYSTREALLVDGTTSIIASFFGSPFPTAVYIGHPGWKKAGARLGYTFLSGTAILALTWLNGISLLSSLIPLVAILPILLYIGLIIGSQAFTSTSEKYAPAVVIGLIPWLANWGQNIVDTALTQAGTSAQKIGYEVFSQSGLEYEGMMILGAGAIIISMVWSSIVVYIIDKDFKKAAFVALLAALISFFGVIHAPNVAIAANLNIFSAYLMIAILFFTIEKFQDIKN